MNITEFRSYVRSLLAEPQASYWTDDEIDAYLSVAMTIVQGQLFHLLYPFYTTSTTLGVTAGSPYVSIPSDSYKIISVQLADNPTYPFYYIPDELVDTYEADTSLSGWRYEGGQIRIYPTPTETKSGYLRVKYLPLWADIEDAPPQLHPLLAVETVIQAKVKDEQVPSYLLVLRENYFRSALSYLTMLQYQNEGNV